MIKKRKKPTFHRQHSDHKKKIMNKPRWRKPRGIYSAQQLGKKSRGKVPQPGYGQPKAVRGKHPSGFEEVLVKNLRQIEGINPKTHAIRLSSSMGMKKKTEAIKKAEEKKIRILNKPVKKPKKKTKKKKEEPKEEKNADKAKKTDKKEPKKTKDEKPAEKNAEKKEEKKE